MPVLVNRTQNNFTMISNNILRDEELSMKDRGLLCTICSLPDKWDFSIAGLSSIVPDGRDSISHSMKRLESLGYLQWNKTRSSDGKFVTEIEVFAERQTGAKNPVRKTRHGSSTTAHPLQEFRHGPPDADNTAEYHTDQDKQTFKMDDIKSIYPDRHNYGNDGPIEDAQISREYKSLIAENIQLNDLLDIATQKGDTEVRMVQEVYSVICDMVCNPRDKVKIHDTMYSWNTVKSQFLKLNYDHVAFVLDNVVNKNLGIKRMYPYLVSMLYTTSLTNTLETQASIHDEYLQSYRGKPYSIS